MFLYAKINIDFVKIKVLGENRFFLQLLKVKFVKKKSKILMKGHSMG